MSGAGRFAAGQAVVESKTRRGGPRRRMPPRTVRALSIATVAILVVLAAAAVVVHNRTISKPGSCPSAAAVDAFLGTQLDNLSSIQEATIFTCTYSDGSHNRALEIDVEAGSARGTSGYSSPCSKRRLLRISGHPACDVDGVRGTAPGNPSILVITIDRHETQIAWQFSSYTTSITHSMLVTVAHNVVTATPNPDI